MDRRITIRHLMHHTSGLQDYAQAPRIQEDYIHRHCPDMRQALHRMAAQPMNFAPGTDTLDSTIYFTILSLIIENVSGMP